MNYYLDPFGCAKNQVDAENMMAFLDKAGLENVSDADLAEIIIVNSCGFIESAKQESINAVLEWRKLYPGKKIFLTGCLSQRYMKELPELLPEADTFFGIEDPEKIAKKIQESLIQESLIQESLVQKSGENSEFTILNSPQQAVQGERPLLSPPGSAYVKISEGCNNNCSYCAIPLIRGNLVSRSIPDIVEECRLLLKRGIVELNIIGQDIGAYGMDFTHEPEKKSMLPELLDAISALDGNFWVRLLYIHPNHFPVKILDLIEKDSRFLPYFDIPFQHASSKILTAMNRNNTSEKNLTLIKTIRTRLPNAVIRSTFMLGFPGETEDDFSALLEFQKKANLDWLGCFTYSREEGTASYSMKERVPAKIANIRKQLIEEKQITITEKNMERFVSQNADVLIEEQFSEGEPADVTEDNIVYDESGQANTIYKENLWLGRLYCQAPDIDGTAVILSDKNLQTGILVKCRIAARRGFDLEVRV